MQYCRYLTANTLLTQTVNFVGERERARHDMRDTCSATCAIRITSSLVTMTTALVTMTTTLVNGYHDNYTGYHDNYTGYHDNYIPCPGTG